MLQKIYSADFELGAPHGALESDPHNCTGADSPCPEDSAHASLGTRHCVQFHHHEIGRGVVIYFILINISSESNRYAVEKWSRALVCLLPVLQCRCSLAGSCGSTERQPAAPTPLISPQPSAARCGFPDKQGLQSTLSPLLPTPLLTICSPLPERMLLSVHSSD